MTSPAPARSHRRVPAVAAAVVALAGVAAADLCAEGVRSPFMARTAEAARGPAGGPTPLDAVEFRGVLAVQGETWCGIFDPASTRTYWIREGAVEAGFGIRGYDPAAGTVLVSLGGLERTVSLRAATIGTAPAATPGPVLVTAPAAPTMVPPPPPGAGANVRGLPPGSFAVAQETPVPPGFVVIELNNATFAVPPGGSVPAGARVVRTGSAAGVNSPMAAPRPRQRVVVSPAPRQ